MHTIDIVLPRPGPKLEAVSTRLKRTLMHPNKSSSLVSVSYSPDGKRIIAGDYPGGVIQVWDANSGRQLTRIEAGYGYRSSSEYFSVAPDWGSVYAGRIRQQVEPIERDGKKLIRWEYDGDVRVWDSQTGALRDRFQHTPPSGVRWLTLSPDGSTIVTVEELPGESEGRPKLSASLWDGRTRQARRLPDGVTGEFAYSPDGKTVAVQANTEGRLAAVKLIDVATTRVRLSIPIAEKEARRIGYLMFSPDGKVLVGQVRDERNTGQHWLKFWDPATGREVASFAGVVKDYFIMMAFSPNSQTLAVTIVATEEPGKLLLFDLSSRTLARAIVLTPKADKADRVIVGKPAFAPDGRWLAVTTQVRPWYRAGEELSAEDLAQPRIHLIDVPAPEVRETLIAPQGFAYYPCFSPDGRTLATGGHGRVVLWDLANLSAARN